MGFIKAFTGAIGGTFADQWKDYYVPAPGVPETAVLFPAVPQGTNNGRGENYKGSNNVITNGSKIVIPEGTALVTLQDGAVTGVISEAGGYTFSSDDPNAQSIFTGSNVIDALVKQSWERFKFGGAPGSQQVAFYVNLRDIPNNRFGTQSEIYWMDAYLNAQVGAITRGTYSVKVVDPVAFIKSLPPLSIQAGAGVLDLADMDSDYCNQMFEEVVGSLAPAFSLYCNGEDKGNSIMKLQQDSIGFAKSLSQAIDENYNWKEGRGLEITKVTLAAVEYDEDSKALLSDVKKADALSGARGNSFMQQSVARGMQAAGENGGAAAMGFMGMGMNAAGGVMGAVQQPTQEAQPDPTAELAKYKSMLDQGLITQEDYDAAKKKILGL